MKRLAISLFSVLAFVLAGAAQAQAQEPEPPALVSVGMLTSTPAHTAQLAELIGKVAGAAKASGIDAKYAWNVFQQGNTFHIVSWPENWAQLDQPNAMWAAIMEGEGMAAAQEAMTAFDELWVTSKSEMLGFVEEWSYMPEAGIAEEDFQGIVVFDSWVRPGMNEEFSENSAGVMAMLAEMGFPYPIYGHRTLMGDENRARFVVIHDGLSNFYGDKSFGQFIEAAGMGEKWSSHFETRQEMIFRNDNFQASYRRDLSYQPEGN